VESITEEPGFKKMLNEKKRMLITGPSGLVGSYFCRLTALKKYRLSTIAHSESISLGNSITVDLSDTTNLFRQAIYTIRPDIIVHLAAMTDVEQCEVERDLADNINHLAAKALTEYMLNTDNRECFLLYVSTDYVFDGEKGCYSEDDMPSPINWYGMTKLLGEQELLNSGSKNWCIARTSTPFGMHTKKSSFPLFIINNLSRNRETKVLTDQITSPTYAFNLAEMLLEIVENRIKGIMHVGGSSQISRFGQAEIIASKFGLNKNLLKPRTIKEMRWKAPRPKNSSLNITKAHNTLSNKPLGFKESLSRFADEFQ
jgi:dTDP-4-dehydrorhamnose reductase